MGRTKVRASGHVAGPASVRLTRRITSTCQSPPLPRAAGSDCARNGSNRTKVFAAFAAAHASPFGRLTRWRGARAGHHLRDIVGSAKRSPKTKAGAQTRARNTNGRLLIDSLTHWDHNLRLRVQSGPLRMVPTVRTLATALCLLGLVAAGIVGGSGLGPTAALARPTPP